MYYTSTTCLCRTFQSLSTTSDCSRACSATRQMQRPWLPRPWQSVIFYEIQRTDLLARLAALPDFELDIQQVYSDLADVNNMQWSGSLPLCVSIHGQHLVSGISFSLLVDWDEVSVEKLVECLIFGSMRVRFAVKSGVILAEDWFAGCRHNVALCVLIDVFVYLYICSCTVCFFWIYERDDEYELRFNTKWFWQTRHFIIFFFYDICSWFSESRDDPRLPL